MAYKIEKNIPRRDTRELIFPFDKMQINDSFFIPEGDFKNTATIRQTVVNKLTAYKKDIKGDYKISIKKTEGGIRVWRIK